MPLAEELVAVGIPPVTAVIIPHGTKAAVTATGSSTLATAVAAAVLAHDFSDGINTVNVVIRHGGSYKKALRWLLVDAIAPVLGVAVTLLFSVSQESLGLLLALFAGFFLYIGASDLIPESHHQHPKFLTTAICCHTCRSFHHARPFESLMTTSM